MTSIRTAAAHKRRTGVVLYWRPIVPGWNDARDTMAYVLDVGRDADAIVFTDYYHKPESGQGADDAARGEGSAARRPPSPVHPDAPLEEAYRADHAVVSKRRGDEAVSSVSAPWLIEEMLGQAANAVEGGLLGRHVLEIGSGGVNAALLHELFGPAGSVTTVDIDSDVTDRVTACLAAAGYDDVTVVCADADQPIDHGRSYDLIIVTVGAWDIPPAWTGQLAETGTLVVPLRTFGMTRSWALRREGDRLTSHSQRLCGFVSTQGSGAHEMRYIDITAGVHLRMTNFSSRSPRRPSEVLSRPADAETVDLRVWPVPGVLVIFRPMSADEIDFDVDLRESQGQAGVDALCGFLGAIGRRLGKPVVMTAEGDYGNPVLGFAPAADRVVLLADPRFS